MVGEVFRVKSITEAHSKVVPYIWENGDLVKDERGEWIKEIMDLTVIFEGPNMSPLEGKLNERFAIDFAKGLIDTNLALKKGDSFHYSYGACMRELDMLNKVIAMLRKNPTTRRAVIPIFQPVHVGSKLEVPCWATVQQLIRNGKLHTIDYFRSNDMWGGAPSDYYGIRALQWYIAFILRVEVGDYIHHVGSAHLRMSDESAIKQYLNKGR